MKRFMVVFILACILLAIPILGFRYEESRQRNPISQVNMVEFNEIMKCLEGLPDMTQEAVNAELRDREVSFSYTILDKNEEVLYRSEEDPISASSIHSATKNRDTIRMIRIKDEVAGYLIIHNKMGKMEKEITDSQVKWYGIGAVLLLASFLLLSLWLYFYVIRPFDQMKEFAASVAAGDLDKPLQMDRGNAFGAFTESFDIMREELRDARQKEYAANLSKKELVAQLSHDIKTPVASIKAMSEVMEATTKEGADQEKLHSIGMKADQIDALVSNLFSVTLHEMEKLAVNLSEEESSSLEKVIRDADYKKRIRKLIIPDCLIQCDKIRMYQVISNIISNSYKYADTEILVESELEENYLCIHFSDLGGGVEESELSLITEQYHRGKNAEGIQGTGLGLYISKELMESMSGSLEVANTRTGLKVSLYFKMS